MSFEQRSNIVLVFHRSAPYSRDVLKFCYGDNKQPIWLIILDYRKCSICYCDLLWITKYTIYTYSFSLQVETKNRKQKKYCTLCLSPFIWFLNFSSLLFSTHCSVYIIASRYFLNHATALPCISRPQKISVVYFVHRYISTLIVGDTRVEYSSCCPVCWSPPSPVKCAVIVLNQQSILRFATLHGFHLPVCWSRLVVWKQIQPATVQTTTIADCTSIQEYRPCRTYSTSSPVGTGMGHPGQLSLHPSAGWEMCTSHFALCPVTVIPLWGRYMISLLVTPVWCALSVM